MSPERITFANNLITGETGILIDDASSRELKWQTNLVWPQGDAKAGHSDSGVVQADPKLLRQGIRYVPSPRSPARDSCSALANIVTDYSGRKRSGLPDIGSDEISESDCLRGPLEPTDVGPSWNRR
jgi:hypothetical protein